MKRCVWIVEMFIKERWEPTKECNLSKVQAIDDKREWEMLNPDDKFRITKYIPEA